jgi:hypothetical protein
MKKSPKSKTRLFIHPEVRFTMFLPWRRISETPPIPSANADTMTVQFCRPFEVVCMNGAETEKSKIMKSPARKQITTGSVCFTVYPPPT